MDPVVGCRHLPPGPQRHAYHKPSGRLPLLSAGPTVTFPAVRHHRPQASTKLYCLVTEAHRCEKLAQSFDAVVPGRDSNPRSLDRKSDALPQHHDATDHRRCIGPESRNTLPFYVLLLTPLQRLPRETKPPHKNQRKCKPLSHPKRLACRPSIG